MKRKTKKILVTGATGFIGSHLVEALAEKNRRVRCLVRRDSFLKNLEYIKSLRDPIKSKIEIFNGDLLDKKLLKKALRDIDIIFHLAAIARPMAIPNQAYFDVNATGTKNLLEACRSTKIKKFIHMSSISAVGPSRDGKPVNESTPCKPVDTYGESKLEAEKILFEYYKKYKIPIVILRPSMVFGERDFEMLRFFKAVKTGFFPIRGRGKMEFCYVQNLVEACLLAEEKGKIGEVYCISNGESYTLNKIIRTMVKEMHIKLVPIFLPISMLRAGGFAMEIIGKRFNFHPPFSKETATWMTTNYWYCSIEKAKKELGYKPKFSLGEGIRRTVKWYKKEGFL